MKASILLNVLALSTLSLTACSDDKYEGEAPNNFYIQPTVESSFSTYYTPAKGRIGDPMPFYDAQAGEFKVLYLQEYDNNLPMRFHPIWTLATKDGANYTNLGETLPIGEYDWQQDAALGTGCCYYNKHDGLYYIYYTGHNGSCDSREVVLRATSPDYKTWTKDKGWALFGDDYGLSKNDFRDPQIFEDGDSVYHMIIATRKGDPKFADFTSQDMKNWEFQGEFNAVWDRMCECPDVFKMGDWWYLVYSEGYQTEWSRKVKYMMADSFEGLKRCFSNPGANWPKDDKEGVLDSRAFYAGKTASNGTDRYIWGWCPFRSGEDIHAMNINVGEKEPNWSGALVCHKIIQHEDGTLTIGKVPAIEAKYSQPVDVNVVKEADDYTLYSALGKCNHISFTVKAASDAERFGISFVRPEDAKKYYTFVVNPEWGNGRRKVNFEQEGSEGKGFIGGADGYIFPRPENNEYKVDIFTDNSVVTMYINDIYGYTQRIYGIEGNTWSINNYGGNITVEDVKVTTYGSEVAKR